MPAGDEMSRNHSIHGMHHSYFYATNCGANCLEASCLWDRSSSLFAQLLKIFWTGLHSHFSAKFRFLVHQKPIILKLNRNNPRPKRLGLVHQRNLSRPKSPGRNDPNSVICTATTLKLFGLVYCPILRLKISVFWHKFTENRKQSTLH